MRLTSGKGYFGSDGKLINHLLFMDDLKLFGHNKKELKGWVDLVSAFSRDIGMEFGINRCRVLVIRKGVKVMTGDIAKRRLHEGR